MTTDRLVTAATALASIDAAGRLADLADHISVVRREWLADPDRAWYLTVGGGRDLADTLHRLTDAPLDDCEAAVAIATGADWPTVACAAIIDYARDLRRPAATRTTTPTLRHRGAIA